MDGARQKHPHPAATPGRAAGTREITVSLLDHYQQLWEQCRGSFPQRRLWQRAYRLSLAQLTCLGRHTLTGLICASGRQFADWSADYRLFSKARWQVQALFRPVLGGVLCQLAQAAPLVTALDDTLLLKTGRRIPGVAYRRDPLSPAFACNLIRAQRFLQLSALLPQGRTPGPARALPLHYEHVPGVPKPRKTAPPEQWKQYRQACRQDNLSTHGAAAIEQCRRHLDQEHDQRARDLIVSVDGSYCNRTVLKSLPPRTTLVGRIRKDAKLHALPQDRSGPGRKRQYGPRLSTPEELRQDDAVPWQPVRAWAAGRVHTFRIKTLTPVLWAKAGAQKRLRLLVIAPLGYRLRKGDKLLYRRPAYLLCTDPDLPLDQVLQSYLWRWDIEVNHRDEKQLLGVGQAQVRSPQSVERQPAFAVASYALLLLAASQAGMVEGTDALLATPKWHRTGPSSRPSTARLLQQVRRELWWEGLDQRYSHCGDFVARELSNTKCLKFNSSLPSAVLYASMG